MLDNISTEKRNNRSLNFDTMSIKDALILMNDEDRFIIEAVKSQLDKIEEAIKLTTSSLKNGGRIIYIGAGTSGRLGVLDAVECPPTFGVSDKIVVGLIAGGKEAFVKAVEGAEDSMDLAVTDLKQIDLSEIDTVIGLAASGRTPYVIGGLDYAEKIGCKRVAISCTTNAEISKHADVDIELLNGPEVLTGSTRLKAGTSQKIVLNMISTLSMKSIGKIYQNLMVDVQTTNEKLVERAKNIVVYATDVTYEVACKVLEITNNDVKLAIVMILNNCSLESAKDIILKNNGFVRK